ncbi:hypothetical protein AVEN_155873-1 [Araneus ventricosus]|uniref:Uncharacterized protein n=1 Tax=Araneus ventricosus TaxID=182803 RepID=A0A4Y2S9F1_ARAVE|nr:hypothetical protein AVEN_155873-1 [Araneus ventricosus]
MIQDDVRMDGREFIKFPSHTQEVERIVKLVTEASRKRVGPQNRDGFIRATLESREQMSQFESKNSAFVILYVSKMSKRGSPEGDGGEGPSQKRPRDTEPAAFSSVAARTRAIEERISELRAEDARTPPLRSRRASNEVAGPPPVPAAVFMKLREENEREIRTLREALHNTQTELVEMKGALENLRTVLEAERVEKMNLESRLREMEPVEGQNIEPPAQEEQVEADAIVEQAGEAADESDDNLMDLDFVLDFEEADAVERADAAVQFDAVVMVDAEIQVDAPVALPPAAAQPRRPRRRAAINPLQAILDDYYDELTYGGNHPKIEKAIFKRVTKQLFGGNDETPSSTMTPVRNLQKFFH